MSNSASFAGIGRSKAGSGWSPAGQSYLIIGFKAGKPCLCEIRAGNDDHIRSRRRLVKPEKLSNKALRTIPDHRTAKLSCGGDAETRHGQFGGEKKDRHIAPLQPGALLINPLKVGPTPNMFGATHGLPHGRPVASPDCNEANRKP
jgi:hypothetical protein